MSLTYGTTELCSSSLSLSPDSRGGRFYNPHRSSRSLRSAPGGPEHAPWSAPTAQTPPERGEAPLAAPTSITPSALPHGPCPACGAPRPSTPRSAETNHLRHCPTPGRNRPNPCQKGSYFLSGLQHPRARAQRETSVQKKKDLVRQDQHVRVSHVLCIPPGTSHLSPSQQAPLLPHVHTRLPSPILSPESP